MTKTDLEAFEHHRNELAKHGWHILATLHIDDIKERLNSGTEIVEMPSDSALNDACAYVASGYAFEGYTDCIDWAVSMLHEWKEEGSI